MSTEGGAAKASAIDKPAGPWQSSLKMLSKWHSAWPETCVKMTTDPWTKGVLPHKTVELISIGVNAACTNLNPDGTRRHIRTTGSTLNVPGYGVDSYPVKVEDRKIMVAIA